MKSMQFSEVICILTFNKVCQTLVSYHAIGCSPYVKCLERFHSQHHELIWLYWVKSSPKHGGINWWIVPNPQGDTTYSCWSIDQLHEQNNFSAASSMCLNYMWQIKILATRKRDRCRKSNKYNEITTLFVLQLASIANSFKWKEHTMLTFWPKFQL